MNNKQALETVRDIEGSIDLRDYWNTIIRNRWQIIGFTVSLTILAAIFIFSLPPIYQGEAVVLIESDEAKVISIDEVYDLGTGRNEYYLTQFEILKSRELAETVVLALDLENHPAFQKKPAANRVPFLSFFISPKQVTEEEKLKNVVDEFRDNLFIQPVRNTQLVKVIFESEDPKLAAEVANSLARIYIENNLEARLQMTQQAASWLSERISGLKTKLDESERALQDYKEKEGLVEVEGVRTLVAKELSEITAKLVEARNQRTQAENIVAQIDTLKDQSIETLSGIPAVLEHSLVQRFKEQEALAEQKLSELSKRYGYKHPKIIAAKSDLAATTKNVEKQIKKVVEGIRKEYEVAKATERSLTRELENVKEKLQDINRKEYRLNELSREAMVNRQLYESFFSRIKETSEAGELQTAHARIVDKAIVPVQPIKPKKVLLIAFVFVATLFIGTFLVFIRDALDRTVKSKEDVTEKIGEQLLGVLPLLKQSQKKTKDDRRAISTTFSKDTKSTFSESIRTIRTGVVLSGLDNPHKILVVTSSVPGEGKTTVSSNLSEAFGQMGRALLIDADMRRPSVASNFGIAFSAPGLSNLVAGTSEPSECIHSIEELGIDV
ncbi:MAG: polysaccharide biosynthesis tyrosine autokinase, partial [Pseudomonadales bacterium]|nr:polysaccharide biosynthesis tyrosine autokinase [Pseudomonadales bacterium]